MKLPTGHWTRFHYSASLWYIRWIRYDEATKKKKKRKKKQSRPVVRQLPNSYLWFDFDWMLMKRSIAAAPFHWPSVVVDCVTSICYFKSPVCVGAYNTNWHRIGYWSTMASPLYQLAPPPLLMVDLQVPLEIGTTEMKVGCDSTIFIATRVVVYPITDRLDKI